MLTDIKKKKHKRANDHFQDALANVTAGTSGCSENNVVESQVPNSSSTQSALLSQACAVAATNYTEIEYSTLFCQNSMQT